MKVKLDSKVRYGSDPTSRMVFSHHESRPIGARASRYVRKLVAQGKATLEE